jgi:hypothetical protein
MQKSVLRSFKVCALGFTFFWYIATQLRGF